MEHCLDVINKDKLKKHKYGTKEKRRLFSNDWKKIEKQFM